MELFVRPDGSVQGLYDETFELGQLGMLSVARASVVEPATIGGWMVDLAPVAGPVLGPFVRRSEALETERRWITDHRLCVTREKRNQPFEQGVTLNAANPHGSGNDLPDAGAHRQLRHAHDHRAREGGNTGSAGAWARRIALVIAGVLLAATVGNRFVRHTQGPSSGPEPTLAHIQKLQQLVTHRVLVSEIHETQVAGYTGSMVVTLVVHGDVLVGVDLQRARIVKKDDRKRELLIELPRPQVISPRLDHDHTHVQHVAFTGLWQMVPGAAAQTLVVGRALREAQASVASAGAASDLLKDAEARTQGVLDAYGQSVGWNIHVCWLSSS